ncbi:hypothetical protein GIB67_003389 [Kingdonia uniflora]|uniref:DUF4228 domain-containing protein n=1 Tax=Kingdonia uniflora TaxID=39325 RepID=A0A7J7P8X1_9MAGN|nr:hypothetical protein GIB67_003389 [Kingdonia uniflora]
MGNCQAIDAASLVIQHPNGRVDRLYWSVTVKEVMRTNPGHYVAFIMTPDTPEEKHGNNGNGVHFTRVKLVRPSDSLVLGQAYRLITSEEVMKGLWERKCTKKKVKDLESECKPEGVIEKLNSAKERRVELEKIGQERQQQRTAISSATARSRPWRPLLQSISESAS